MPRDYFGLIGEASSTLGASSLKNFSAVSGCHSLSEAMFLVSLSLLGLICSLHDCTSFKIVLTSEASRASPCVFTQKQSILYLNFSVLSIGFWKISQIIIKVSIAY